MAQASDGIVELLRTDILRGRLPQGSRLRETELSERLGVSRTPVREALRLLASEGLVEVLPNRGARVVEWTAADIEEMYDLRVLLEGHAAERAATRIDADNLARLISLCDQMEASVDDPADTERLSELNAEFHNLIIESAASPRLDPLLHAVVHMPLVTRTFQRYGSAERRRSMTHHRELTEAFTARDARWAASVMHVHILAAKAALVNAPSDRTTSQVNSAS